ncbi:PREDICTED: LOW QUALITY PROTEIN: kinesin-like protein KIF25 [Chinchilla lanigera]|uniref:LOW QUALITY PROTEIN: kinesin-like protein KIF25 n=1 Tax=Chinchilla lanigera TaxID=34839 RepID=UPI000698FBE1|nr:PREDICTED: LOW QUALITY PROTEIN: kinesin-like protein KIF25 [Chinchilla lanigera]
MKLPKMDTSPLQSTDCEDSKSAEMSLGLLVSPVCVPHMDSVEKGSLARLLWEHRGPLEKLPGAEKKYQSSLSNSSFLAFGLRGCTCGSLKYHVSDYSEDRNMGWKASSSSREAAHTVDEETIVVQCHRPGHPLINKTYNFERVYRPAEPQTAVFADVCLLLTSLLDGYNIAKSYTILGPGLPSDAHSDLGLIPRAVEELFRLISGNPSESPKVDVSIVEIYNNNIFDLLAKDNSTVVSGSSVRWSVQVQKRNPLTKKRFVGLQGLRVSTGDTKVGFVSFLEVSVPDFIERHLLTERCSIGLWLSRWPLVISLGGVYALPFGVPFKTCLLRAITSVLEFMELLHQGLQLRARNPTPVHVESSRSHLIITVTLTTATSLAASTGGLVRLSLGSAQEQVRGGAQLTGFASRAVPVDPGGRRKQVRPRLQLVDLAGSECAGVSGVTGLALRETSFINRSLTALADILGALSEHRGHIPYWNSKLTHLLQDSIGGDTKLLVILCVFPGQKHVVETLQSLGFGTRAQQVKRGWVRKKPPHSQVKELCLGSA